MDNIWYYNVCRKKYPNQVCSFFICHFCDLQNFFAEILVCKMEVLDGRMLGAWLGPPELNLQMGPVSL